MSDLTIYKVMVLELLDLSEVSLSNNELTEFFLEKGYTDYFSLVTSLGELHDNDFIGEEKSLQQTRYFITSTGKEILNSLREKLSPAIKNDIKNYLKEKKQLILSASSFFSNYYKSSVEGFDVRLVYKEKDSTKIDLNVNVPSEEVAKSICDNWKKHYEDVYFYLMELLVE